MVADMSQASSGKTGIGYNHSAVHQVLYLVRGGYQDVATGGFGLVCHDKKRPPWCADLTRGVGGSIRI